MTASIEYIVYSILLARIKCLCKYLMALQNAYKIKWRPVYIHAHVLQGHVQGCERFHTSRLTLKHTHFALKCFLYVAGDNALKSQPRPLSPENPYQQPGNLELRVESAHSQALLFVLATIAFQVSFSSRLPNGSQVFNPAAETRRWGDNLHRHAVLLLAVFLFSSSFWQKQRRLGLFLQRRRKSPLKYDTSHCE